jgi:transketolase
MRRLFHPILLEYMRKDSRIRVCTADLGYKMFDAIAAEFPERFINCGAAEQLLLGIGVGLADDDFIPICYSITPFLLKRPLDWIDNYMHHENVPVKLLGGGRDKDYAHDGYSHDASMDKKILALFPNIKTFHPNTEKELISMTEEYLYNGQPSYMNLSR